MLTPEIIAKMLDHSTLQPWLTEADIRKGCEIALRYKTATVCARPGDMKLVSQLLEGSGVLPCTVIGFPHGAHLTSVKVFEAEQAVADGCKELDMVINIGRMKGGDYDYVEGDIRAVAEAAHKGGAILKVIIETCYLTDEETPEDVALMRAAVSNKVKVKAAGGMRTLDAILAVRAAGADRCGVSATEAIMQEAEKRYAEGTLGE